MRDLTRPQKRMLDRWFNAHKDEIGMFTDTVQLMTYEEWEALQSMNDTEVLYQNVNNYITEKV